MRAKTLPLGVFRKLSSLFCDNTI
ncbi:hypothetical protein MED222_05320 [Vibrio sp. MED222]|nr:hypothetical protein MED222_05320 [Vibrio sp. MED222]